MVSRLRAALVCVAVALTMSVAACGSRGDDREEAKASASRASSPAPASPAAAASSKPEPTSASRPRIVVLGDSLTAGLGIAARDAYPALLQQRIDASGLDFEVVNAGVSGDTSAGGLARLDWALQGDVRILIVALGGNDALRALPAEELTRNLSAIIEKAQSRGIAVLLAGMEAPPNFGRDYIVSFHHVYPALAKQYHVAFVPFLLQGVAGSDTLNQRDGIHPTAEGARILADNVWAVLKPLAETKRQTGS
jgi:acyl-CoA thioesterase-1